MDRSNAVAPRPVLTERAFFSLLTLLEKHTWGVSTPEKSGESRKESRPKLCQFLQTNDKRKSIRDYVRTRSFVLPEPRQKKVSSDQASKTTFPTCPSIDCSSGTSDSDTFSAHGSQSAVHTPSKQIVHGYVYALTHNLNAIQQDKRFSVIASPTLFPWQHRRRRRPSC